MTGAPHPLRLVSYRPGDPPPPRPAPRKRADGLDRRTRDRMAQALTDAWFKGFCVGILTGFGVLLVVTAMHYAGRGW